MRKHFYLITEHPNREFVGRVEITDQRKRCTAEKNAEGVCRKLDLDTGEEYHYHLVGLGYSDFQNEDDYEERAGAVSEDKLHEIDGHYLEKAGLELTEAGPA